VAQRAAGGIVGGRRRSSVKVRVATPVTQPETDDDRRTMTDERMALLELVERTPTPIR
jgi:hypothetical protein